MKEVKPVFVYKMPLDYFKLLSNKQIKELKRSIEKSLGYNYIVMLVSIEDFAEFEIVK
jgi:hypothetical protein